MSVIENLAKEEGSDDPGYVIPPDVTLGQCIGYAQRFVVGSPRDRPHYRYDRYLETLDRCMQDVPFDQSVRTAMHLDLGAGPGLFTWVFWDFMHSVTSERKGLSLDLFGYDHATEMSTLAKRVWDGFGLQAAYRCLDSEDAVYASVWPQGPPTNVLITLGHSLMQVHRHGGLAIFAELCEAVAGLDRSARLVAVDAHSRERPLEFDTAWEEFRSMMKDSRVRVRHKGPSERVATVELLSGPWRRQ